MREARSPNTSFQLTPGPLRVPAAAELHGRWAAMRAILPVLAFVLLAACSSAPEPRKCSPAQQASREIPAAWLRAQMTIEEAHAFLLRRVEADVADLPVAPAQAQRDWLNEEWTSFRASYRNGDQVWHYRSGLEDWASLGGRDGLVLIRDCKQVRELIFEQS